MIGYCPAPRIAKGDYLNISCRRSHARFIQLRESRRMTPAYGPRMLLSSSSPDIFGIYVRAWSTTYPTATESFNLPRVIIACIADIRRVPRYTPRPKLLQQLTDSTQLSHRAGFHIKSDRNLHTSTAVFVVVVELFPLTPE